MYKEIPINVIVYTRECSVARFYLHYLKENGYKAEKITILLNGELPKSGKFFWNFVPKKIIANIREYINLRKRSSGEMRTFIQEISHFFSIKVNLMSKFNFHDYSRNVQLEVISGFYDKKLKNILSEQKNKNFLYTCGGIVKKDLLEIKNAKFIHIHPGIVPEVKGSDGFWWSLLLRGVSGASCFFMNSGIDTGDVILKKDYKLPKMHLSKIYSNETIFSGSILAIDPHIRSKLLIDVIKKHEVDIQYAKTEKQIPGSGNDFYHMHSQLKKKVVKEKLFTSYE